MWRDPNPGPLALQAESLPTRPPTAPINIANYHTETKKMLATQNLDDIMLIIRISVPKIDLKLIVEVCLHFTIRS